MIKSFLADYNSNEVVQLQLGASLSFLLTLLINADSSPLRHCNVNIKSITLPKILYTNHNSLNKVIDSEDTTDDSFTHGFLATC